MISPSRLRLVDGLSDVDVELLPRRHADEEAIPGNRFLNLARIGVEHIGGAMERGITRRARGGFSCAERCTLRLGLLQATRHPRNKGLREQLHLLQVVGSEQITNEASRAVAQSELSVHVVLLTLQSDAVKHELGAVHVGSVSPDNDPPS